MKTQHVVAIVAAIIIAVGGIIAAIIQKSDKPTPESLLKATDNKEIWAIKGESIRDVTIHHDETINIFAQGQVQIPKENKPLPKPQQLGSDSQLAVSDSVPKMYSLKGNIKLATGATEPFDNLLTSSEEQGRTEYLDTYYDSSGSKHGYVDLKDVSSLTFGVSSLSSIGSFISLKIVYKDGVSDDTYAALCDEVTTVTRDGSSSSSKFKFYEIERIDFK